MLLYDLDNYAVPPGTSQLMLNRFIFIFSNILFTIMTRVITSAILLDCLLKSTMICCSLFFSFCFCLLSFQICSVFFLLFFCQFLPYLLLYIHLLLFYVPSAMSLTTKPIQNFQPLLPVIFLSRQRHFFICQVS